MFWLLSFLGIIILNHVLMWRVCRVLGPPPEKERPIIVFSIFCPFINIIIAMIMVIALLIGHDKAPLMRFYNAIFCEKKDV